MVGGNHKVKVWSWLGTWGGLEGTQAMYLHRRVLDLQTHLCNHKGKGWSWLGTWGGLEATEG